MSKNSKLDTDDNRLDVDLDKFLTQWPRYNEFRHFDKLIIQKFVMGNTLMARYDGETDFREVKCISGFPDSKKLTALETIFADHKIITYAVTSMEDFLDSGRAVYPYQWMFLWSHAEFILLDLAGHDFSRNYVKLLRYQLDQNIRDGEL